MDTDRCLCLTRDGARADVGYERCRALVAARED
jgi:hypothetical protein